MKPQDTLTYKDIMEIPSLLEDFSRRAPGFGAAALRSKDKAVYLVGRGSSGNATLFAKYIWEVYSGVITNFIHPHSIFEARVPLRFKDQSVWAFSQSGKSSDIVAALKKLISWGARGVAVTNEPDLKANPLARLAGSHILLSGSREVPVAATKSFILQLWAVLWTARLWSGCFKDKDFTDTIALIREFLASGFDPSKAGFWPKLRKAGVIGFVGRGPYNAVADDSALKFREMARAHALGYSAAEFLHGPVGAYTSKDFVFLFSPSKELPDDMEQVRLALNDRKTPYCVIAPAKGRFPFNCLLADIEIKLTALHLAAAKGLNPDNPKGLNKVTQTF
ncbi:MAG: SIS domain-containing protein [Elusimicrobiales bacterium]|jgi:glucosamine--fructose-6-phosphate aminotransferase (isomerizing)